MQYTVTRRFQTRDITWFEGDLVDLDDDTAAWVERDSPGCLRRVEPEPEARAIDEAPANRMVAAPVKKRTR